MQNRWLYYIHTRSFRTLPDDWARIEHTHSLSLHSHVDGHRESVKYPAQHFSMAASSHACVPAKIE